MTLKSHIGTDDNISLELCQLSFLGIDLGGEISRLSNNSSTTNNDAIIQTDMMYVVLDTILYV